MHSFKIPFLIPGTIDTEQMDDLTFFLTAPFYVAETLMLSEISEPTEPQIKAVERLRDSAVSVYLKYITRKDGTFNISKITPCLSMGLWWFQSSSIKTLALTIKPLLIFPPDASIDWLTLISGFTAIRQGRQKQLGELGPYLDLINRIEFTEVISEHLKAKTFYDESIVNNVLTTGIGGKVLTRLAERALLVNVNKFDNLPSDKAVKEIGPYINELDFLISHVDLTGNVSEHLYLEREDRPELTAHLKKVLALFQKKEVVLKGRIEDKEGFPLTDQPLTADKVIDKPLTFGDFLIGEHKDVLLKALKNTYTDQTPRYIACMLYALSDLGIISPAILNNDKTALHRALEASFGNIGKRTALNEAINRLNRPTPKHRDDMKREKQIIAAMIPN